MSAAAALLALNLLFSRRKSNSGREDTERETSRSRKPPIWSSALPCANYLVTTVVCVSNTATTVSGTVEPNLTSKAAVAGPPGSVRPENG